jgi:hypothetical protein
MRSVGSTMSRSGKPKVCNLNYLKTDFAELQSKINFLARNKIYIVKIYNDTK